MAETTAAGPPLPEAALERLLLSPKQWRRRCAEGDVYAVVDASSSRSAPAMARRLGPSRAISLFRSPNENLSQEERLLGRRVSDAERYAHVAPYLFHLDAEIFDWIAGPEIWSQPWGILIQAHGGLSNTRRHLRRHLRVRGVDKKVYFLRFYDPRLLPPFLESCTPAELKSFFGPINAIGVGTAENVLMFKRTRQSAAPDEFSGHEFSGG
jgi:hypothetical protein